MKKTVFIIAAVLFFHQYLFSQKIWIEGYDIMDVKRILYKGDSVIAFYQPKGLVFRNADMYPEYFTGLPDSLPPLPDGKYLLFSFDVNSKDTVLFHEWYMKDGKRDSVWIVFYNNDSPYKISQYKDGKPEGRQLQMDESGKIINDYYVRNGLLEGYASYFDENEMLFAKGRFYNGKETGKWEFSESPDSLTKSHIIHYYDTLGYTFCRQIFKNDSLVEETISKKHSYKHFINGKKVRPHKTKRRAPKTHKEKETVFNGILFSEDLSEIDTASFSSFNDVITVLKKNPEWKIILKFYTVYPQPDTTPKWIHPVVKYFIDQGINPSRIYPQYYPFAKYVVRPERTEKIKNANKKERLIRKNQRVAYSLIKK